MTEPMTPAERRRALIDDLRNLPPEWPWNFDDGVCCALGRAKAIALAGPYNAAMGIPDAQYGAIFGFPNYGWTEFYGVRSRSEVTPQMVADALERLGE